MSRLKSRKGFLDFTKPLNSSPVCTRLEMCETLLQETPIVIKMGLQPAESLPAGSDQPRLCWRSPNSAEHRPTWHYIDETHSTKCDFGEEQTILHLLCCRLLDDPYTPEDPATATDRAKTCAIKWQHLFGGVGVTTVSRASTVSSFRQGQHSATTQYVGVRRETGRLHAKIRKVSARGSAGMAATLFVQPLDLVKNRMQLSGEGTKAREHKTSFHAIRSILRNEGFIGMYSGLSAGLLRQATYTTTRLGVYTILFEHFSKDGQPPSFLMKAGLGMTAGAVGSFIGTPAEISLIRMTADGRLPVAQRRNYSHVFNAIYRISREEGVLTLWRGCGPTVVRAMVVNAAQLASYSQAKQLVLSTGYFKDNILLHFIASMISGLVTTGCSMPVDIVKTRIQNMKIIDGKPEYTGAMDVLRRVVRGEGFFSLWKGFTPYYARIGPHTVLTFIFLEQMNKFYSQVVLKETGAVRSSL